MTRSAVVRGPGVDVETATWPPARVELVDGWRVGLSGGFTRRANSAVPPRTQSRPGSGASAAGTTTEAALARTLDRVEALYARAGQPAVVRLDRDHDGTPLAALLDARGYLTVARTDVLVATGDVPARIARASDAGASAWTVAAAPVPDDAWLDTWLAVKAGDHPVDRGAVRRVLVGCPSTYLTARDEEGVAGVVRAAVAGGWVGLSCLMVVGRARRRGLATLLTREALVRASAAGPARAFLQVERANVGARALYERLGLVVADSYAYRERPLPRR